MGIWVKLASWDEPRQLYLGPHGGLHSMDPNTDVLRRLSSKKKVEVEKIPGFKKQKKTLLKRFQRI